MSRTTHHLVARVLGLLVPVVVLSLAGCKSTPSASAEMIDARGQKLGTLSLNESSDGVHIKGVLRNLPVGLHAIHIHEKGAINPPDFKTAGGHFNPFGKQHGMHNPKGMHAGDLPNINVGSDVATTVDLTANYVTLEKGKPNSILKDDGAALIIHERADDDQTDPAGNSGVRIAGGAIVETK